MANSICRKKFRVSDYILKILIYISASLSILLLACIVGFVFFKGIGSVNLAFLTTEPSTIKGTFGIAGNIVNTLYIIGLTLLIATPIGVGSAIYLNEYAKPGRFVRMIEFTTETLAGIPSIIFGLFGMVFFGTTLGMGATKWYLIRTILLPSAMPGIITGVILAVGRIVGESAALLFTAGSGYLLPKTAAGALNKIFESGGTLTIQLYLSMSKAKYDQAFGIAFVLLTIVLLINILTKYLAKKFDVNLKA